MFRIVLPVLLAVAGCAAPPQEPTLQVASASAAANDPALMAIFFGAGTHRAISPVIRCPVRCQDQR